MVSFVIELYKLKDLTSARCKSERMFFTRMAISCSKSANKLSEARHRPDNALLRFARCE